MCSECWAARGVTGLGGATPATAAGPPSITVVPDTGLALNPTVQVGGSGWSANQNVSFVECVGPGANCIGLGGTGSGSGTFAAVPVVVHRVVNGNDCVTEGCRLVALWPLGPSPTELASHDLGFDASIPLPKLEFLNNSNLGLLDGDAVSFRLSGFTAGSQVNVKECAPGAQISDCGGVGNQTTVTIGNDSTFTGTLAVAKQIGGVNCQTSGRQFPFGCFLLAQSQTTPDQPARDNGVWPGLWWGRITASPITDLGDGSTVHVTGLGWVPDEDVVVAECVNGDAGPGFCGQIDGQNFTPIIGDPTTDGTFTLGTRFPVQDDGTFEADVAVVQSPVTTPPPDLALTTSDCTENGQPPTVPPVLGGDQCFLVANQTPTADHAWSGHAYLYFGPTNQVRVQSPAGGSPLTITAPEGTTLTDVQALPAPTTPAWPDGEAFPLGILGFNVHVAQPGDPATVTIDLPPGTHPDAYYKLTSTPAWVKLLAPAAVVSGDRITLHLQDGVAPGDQDGTANAVITEPGAPAVTARQLTTLSDVHAFVGLRNSDDQGTLFDLQVELLQNGNPVASGLTRCVPGVTRNPSLAKQVVVPWYPLTAPLAVGTNDALALRISARIGTNPNGTKCTVAGGSHNSATGLRVYYDAAFAPVALRRNDHAATEHRPVPALGRWGLRLEHRERGRHDPVPRLRCAERHERQVQGLAGRELRRWERVQGRRRVEPACLAIGQTVPSSDRDPPALPSPAPSVCTRSRRTSPATSISSRRSAVA